MFVREAVGPLAPRPSARSQRPAVPENGRRGLARFYHLDDLHARQNMQLLVDDLQMAANRVAGHEERLGDVGGVVSPTEVLEYLLLAREAVGLLGQPTIGTTR